MGSHTDLNGKRVLVTGGTTGIGRETIALLARAGARVLTFGRDQEALDDALAYTDGVEGFTADIADREGIDRVFTAVDEKLGGIDVLVVCAALGAEPIHEMTDADWRYTARARAAAGEIS